MICGPKLKNYRTKSDSEEFFSLCESLEFVGSGTQTPLFLFKTIFNVIFPQTEVFFFLETKSV